MNNVIFSDQPYGCYGRTGIFSFLTRNMDDSEILRRIHILSGEATPSNLFCLNTGKGSILKIKNMLPMGANSFLLE